MVFQWGILITDSKYLGAGSLDVLSRILSLDCIADQIERSKFVLFGIPFANFGIQSVGLIEE